EIGEHLRAHVAGVSTLGFGMTILPADCDGRGPELLRDLAYQGERRANQEIAAQIRTAALPRDLSGEGEALLAQTIHFPVSGNERASGAHEAGFPLAAVNSDLDDSESKVRCGRGQALPPLRTAHPRLLPLEPSLPMMPRSPARPLRGRVNPADLDRIDAQCSSPKRRLMACEASVYSAGHQLRGVGNRRLSGAEHGYDS